MPSRRALTVLRRLPSLPMGMCVLEFGGISPTVPPPARRPASPLARRNGPRYSGLILSRHSSSGTSPKCSTRRSRPGPRSRYTWQLQYVAAYNPEYLFGTGYETVYAGYYDTVVDKSASDQDVVTALGAIGVKALMPQIILPSAAELKGQNVTALLACVIRELATQFVPTYNYDALIYTDYNSKSLVKGKNSGYYFEISCTSFSCRCFWLKSSFPR